MNTRIVLAGLIFILVASTGGSTQGVGSEVLLEVIPVDEISNALDEAPYREGPAPDTPDGIPHQQHNQNAPQAMQEALRNAVSTLPGIEFEPTPFSLSGSVGWRLRDRFAQGPAGAFIRQSLEFAHQHRPADGSLHMLLPLDFAIVALEKGWGVLHPWTDSLSGDQSEYVMIFGPRDEGELKTVWIIAQISYYYARGLDMKRKG